MLQIIGKQLNDIPKYLESKKRWKPHWYLLSGNLLFVYNLFNLRGYFPIQKITLPVNQLLRFTRYKGGTNGSENR